MRLIHITDLHFTCTNAFQQALIEAMLKDFGRLYESGYVPDFLVFSGDLVNNPDEKNVYQTFEKAFLLPVLQVLRLAPEEVIFCPGNHDISRSSLEQWKDERRKLVQAMSEDQSGLDRHLAAAPTKAFAFALSAQFFELANRCGNPWDNPFVHTYSYPAKKVGFIAINTGYGCGTEGSQYDRGKLAVSGSQVLEAFQKLPSDYQKLSLMHHTVSDLNESSSRILNPMLSKQSTAHLFGHVHQAFPTFITTSNASCFMIQGGALYERSGQYNGYACIASSDDDAHLVARYRTYYTDRQEFDVGTNVAPMGQIFNSFASKSYWENLTPAPSNDDVCLWLLETADATAKELDGTIIGKSLLSTFVEPPITKQQPNEDDATNSSHKFTIEDILKSRDHTVLCCPSEYGATSILSYLAMKFHSDCLNLPKAVVPLFLDARRFRGNYEASISASLRAALPESDQRQFKLGSLHENGRLVILVDDVDPSNNQHLAYISGIRQFYPRARLIVAAKLDLLNTERLRPAIAIDRYDLLRVGTLSRTKVRGLVEKWKLPAAFQADAVVDEIQSRFEVLGIPQTAGYVSIYLSVVEQIEGYNPINSSTVIENFVEAALQKYKPQYIFRSSFDYRNQIDYLGFIAEKMCRLDSFLVPYEVVYEWTKEHFDRIGVEHDYSKLIQHFVENKVLADEGNYLFFRYNIFLAFFVAHRMQQSAEFLQWLLVDFRYINFTAELDIYFGLSRRDLLSLEFIGQQFAALSAQWDEEVKPFGWADRLENLSIPAAKKTDMEEFTASIERQLTGDGSPKARDEALGGEDKTPSDVRPRHVRQVVQGTFPRWVMMLRAYTVALKNLENIPKEKKEEHLSKILDGWSKVILYACVGFRDIIEVRELEIAGTKVHLDLPNKVDARTVRAIFLKIPVVISELLRRDLGSPKLALQLKNDDLATSLSDSFLQTGLFADLKLSEYLGRLKSFRARADKQNSMIFLEIMLEKMRLLFLRLGLDESEQPAFLAIAAEISAQLKGLDGEDRKREIVRYMAELKKTGRVSRLRDIMQ